MGESWQVRIMSPEEAAMYKRRRARQFEGEKYCGRCSTTKPATSFYSNRSKTDGLDTMCADCKNEYERDKARGGYRWAVAK